MLIFNKILSKWVINSNVSSKPSRPFPFSMYSSQEKKENRVLPSELENEKKMISANEWEISSFTSWESLTNKQYSNRLLPPLPKEKNSELPPIEKIASSFLRKGKPMVPCHKSSILFMGFAQWFTDAFLRVDLEDIRKNTSNHEIDLCQIYGLTKGDTDILRCKKGGRLKTQFINGKEFPPFLFDENLKVKPCFEKLTYVNHLSKTYGKLWENKERRKLFFVTGLGRGNSTITHAAINILFVRLHNKVAGLLERSYSWEDEQLFETTRNILIVLLIKITIEDYVNHIKPFKWLKFVFDTSFAENKNWYRTNWISTEFNLAYRWHSLIPDAFSFNGKIYETEKDFRFNNGLVVDNDLTSILHQMSYQKAGKISLENTPDFMYFAELSGMYISRASRLQSYIEYRKQFRNKFQKLINKDPVKKFSDITKDEKLTSTLKSLYDDNVNNVEFLVGLLAEDPPASIFYDNKPILGTTMLNMVASDAFSHALTNPLLSKKVFNEATFSPLGMELIKKTSTLKQLVSFVEEKEVEVGFDYNKITKKL